MKAIFLAWIRYHRRSELLAQAFGAAIHYVYEAGTRGVLPTGLRYLRQARQTWEVLASERPQVIFVQNPPIFAVVVVALYAWRRHAGYVIDSHSGAFNSAKWRWSIGLHRLLSRHALLTIVHNRSQEGIVQKWGCRYEVVGYTPGNYDIGQPTQLNGAFNVVFVSTFSQDEPLSLVLEAARCLPEVSFYVTGDSRRVAPAIRDHLPANCHLTGYLSYEDYVSLLKSADAILALTTRDHTLSMAGFEAVALGKPLVVSDWPVLVSYFDSGTVYVSNTAVGIVQGVRQARQEADRLRAEMIQLRARLTAEWEDSRRRIAVLVERTQPAASVAQHEGSEAV